MALKNESLYFRDIQRYDTLSEKDEKELVRRVKDHDQEALKDLLRANLRFVVSVARRYMGRGLSLMELVNEGNLGLFRAARRFEIGKEVKFISYAVWWIRQAIQQALFEQVCTIKIPPNKIALVSKFKRAMAQNGGSFDKTIELPEFEAYRNEITEVLDKVSTISLEAQVGEDSGTEKMDKLLDMIGQDPDQEKETERRELSEAIRQVLSQISEREEKILRMYYGIDNPREYTLDEIGKELGLTRERVRQIKTKALRKLMRGSHFRSKLQPFA